LRYLAGYNEKIHTKKELNRSTKHQSKSTPYEKAENVDGSTISNESTNLSSSEGNQQEEILKPEVTTEDLKKLFQQPLHQIQKEKNH